MHACSSLSEDQRQSAVALFETGWGAKSVATRLGVRDKRSAGYTGGEFAEGQR